MKSFRAVAKRAVAILCLAIPALAHADTILTLDGNFAAPDYTFYSYTDSAGNSHGNIPISPYITNLNGGGYNNASALTFCYDYDSDTPVGTALSGSVELVGSFTGAAYTEIMESTYLVNELMTDGGLSVPLATRGALSFAIWELMNPTSATGFSTFPSNPDSLSYEAQAASAVSSGAWTVADANLYPTWVPVDPAYQRFAVVDLTPEPSTLVLTALGLLGLAVVGNRRKVFARIKTPSN